MRRSAVAGTVLLWGLACGSDGESPGGSGGTNGAGSGGASTSGGKSGSGGGTSGGGSASGGSASGGSASGGGSSGGVPASGGSSAGGASSGGAVGTGGSGTGGAAGPNPRGHFDGVTRRPDVSTTPVADCAGQPDMALCRVVTTPDRDYDVCVEGVCVSPGCGEPACNVPSPHFPIPPGSRHTYMERSAGAEPTVADLITGLEWQACPVGTSGADCSTGEPLKVTRDEALVRCDQLSWDGKGDWYLPDSYELMSIIDFANGRIDTSLFGLPGGATWTTHGSESSLRVIYITEPLSGSSFIGSQSVTRTAAVLCVRRGASGDVGYTGERFVTVVPESTEPVVSDRATGLSWQRCTAGRNGPDCDEGGRTLLPSEQWWGYCDALEWGGATDWRLPTHKELYSVLEFSRIQVARPRIDFRTFDVFSTTYLGSTTGWESTDGALLFDVEEGSMTGPNSSATYPLLCVRWTEP